MYTEALKISAEERLETFGFLKRCSTSVSHSLSRERRIFQKCDPTGNLKPRFALSFPILLCRLIGFIPSARTKTVIQKTKEQLRSDSQSINEGTSCKVSFMNDSSDDEIYEQIVLKLPEEKSDLVESNFQEKEFSQKVTKSKCQSSSAKVEKPGQNDATGKLIHSRINFSFRSFWMLLSN